MITGSNSFFSEYPDFNPEDIDVIEFVSTDLFKYNAQIRFVNPVKKCIFQFKKGIDKEIHIEHLLNKDCAMAIAKFLLPEFCKEINFNFEDLKRLSPVVERLDEKHLYLGEIFNYYLENGGFFLTQKQRDSAYETYKKARPERYSSGKEDVR